MSHANAPFTPQGRLLLCQRIEAGTPIAHVASAMGISRRCASKWWHRYQELGADGLFDRSSRPRRSPARTPAKVEARICAIRRSEKLGPDRIAGRLELPASTVHRVLVRHDLGRLDHMDRQTGREIRRYERSRPGELVHVDVKKLGRIPRAVATGPGPGRLPQGQGPSGPRRLRLHPLGRRRLLPSGLLRGLGRRDRDHLGRLLAPGRCLVPSPRGRRRAGLDRQRLQLPGKPLQRGASRDPDRPPLLPALSAPDQRQGGTLQPDPARGMGLRAALLLRVGSDQGP